MMYIKPANDSPGRSVPDDEAQEAAQDMANDQWCQVLIFKEAPLGISIPIGTANPVGEKKLKAQPVEVKPAFGFPVAVKVRLRPDQDQ